ncbi:MAG: hypothetical protein QM756_17540 [Polyangiaceae bacterium]
MTKRFRFVAGLAFCMGLASAADAALPPGFIYAHGSVCVPYDQLSQASYANNQWGIQALFTDPIKVGCNLGAGVGSTFSHRLVVAAYDRNIGSEVNCTLYQTTLDGTLFFVMSKSTSGASAASQSLVFESVGSQILGSDYYTYLECWLPGKASNGSFSHLTSITGY